tara:strand:+ start:348 stop:1013 length:666 start_codon:yes stop_codon:yes gene_type:complete
MDNYIRESLRKGTEKLLFNRIVVYIKDPLPENFDLDYVFSQIQEVVPEHLSYGVDSIFVGQFDDIEERELDALYKDGAIYTTNQQRNEDDMINDIIHELSHANEETYAALIYADGKIENEFLGKRKKLLDILKSEGYNVSINTFMDTEYSKDFDMFLYKEVGYEKLTMFTMGLFVSLYGATSLREYFANGFEHYFLHDPKYVKTISPAVYEKVDSITFMEI